MTNLGFLLMNSTKRLKGELNRALQPAGLTISQWAVLAALARSAEPLTAVAVATATGMDKVTVSGVVQRLVAKALVAETPKPGDRRARELRLTRAGQQRYVACAATADETLAEFLAPLSATDQATLTGLMRQLEGETDDHNLSTR